MLAKLPGVFSDVKLSGVLQGNYYRVLAKSGLRIYMG